MIRTKNVGGFMIFVLTISLLWFGIIVINVCWFNYWFYQQDEAKRLIRVIPLTKIGTLLFILFNWLGYLATVSHFRASLWNPGIITNEIAPPGEMDEKDIRGWKRWNLIWKPIRAHHCSECNVWIFKMDHHCPWINNCVGVRNTKYFFLFTLYVGLGALLSIAILITCFILLLQDEEVKHTKKSHYTLAFFLWICVFIESILFSFFTLELVGEQLESFQDNQTYIDDLKDLIGIPLTLFDSFFVWLGEDWLFWLLPTRPIQCINYWERLFRIQEVISKQYLKLPNIDYDPKNKQKAVEAKHSRFDRIFFIAFTTLGIATCYYLAM